MLLTRLTIRVRRSAVGAALVMGVCAGPAWSAASDAARTIEQQFRRGDTTLALRALDQALAEQPGDAHLRFLQAVLLTETGRTAEAARLLERMTQDYPELAEPHNNLAVLRAAAGQLDDARALLETALRLAPDYRTARENLGDVFVQLALRAYTAAAAGTQTEPGLARKLTLAQALGQVR